MDKERRYSWDKLSTNKFEELSLDYAKKEYPEYKWKLTVKGSTGGQGDGNKDIEAINYKTIPLEKYWIEAKSKATKFNTSITKGQGDPTLVSALLDRHVKFLIFITSGSISANYMKRAQSILFRDGCEKVFFVEGLELEEWLDLYPNIAKNYFDITNIPVETKKALEIRHINIYEKAPFSQGILSEVRSLKKGDIYILYFRFYLQNEANIQISVNPTEFCIILTEKEKYNKIYSRGAHNIEIRWIARKPKEYSNASIIIQYNEHKYIHKLYPFIIENHFDFTIQYQGQTKVIENLKEKFLTYHKRREKHLNVIYGNGGVGKTYVLNQLEKEIPEHVHFKRYKFSNNTFSNSKILCDFLLRINYSTYSDSGRYIFKEILLQNVVSYTHFISKEIVLKLFQGTEDGAEGIQVIRELLTYWQKDSFVSIEGNGDYKAFVLEDIHYLNTETASFLIKILDDLNNSRLNCFIAFSGRTNEFAFSELKIKLDNICIFKNELDSLTSDDINNTVYSIIGQDISLPEKVEDGLKISILNFIEFLTQLKTNISKYNNEIELLRFIRGAYSLSPEKIFEEQLQEHFIQYSQEKDIIDCLDLIMLMEDGVDYSFINKFLSENQIKTIVGRKIINTNGKLIVPYHDLILEKYKQYRGIRLGDNILDKTKLLHNKNPFDDRLLSILTSCTKNAYHEEVKLRVKTLLREKKYSIVNFILKNIFRTLQNDNLMKIPINEELWVRFYYAMSSDHIGKHDIAFSEYSNVIKLGEKSKLNDEERTIIYEAQTEIFNYEYWNLKNTKQLVRKIADFIETANIDIDCYPEMAQMLPFKKAFLNAYNRAMVCNFLLDNYKASEDYFLQGKLKCTKLKMKKDLGYLYMDYAKATYHLSLEASLKFLEKAKNIFEELKTENRRLCICNTDIDFIKILLNKDTSLSSLHKSVENLKNNSYYAEYKKGLMKEIACLLVKQNYNFAKRIISTLIKNYDFTDKSRNNGILANIMSAYYFATKNKKEANTYCNMQKYCFSKLGDSYNNIWKHNLIVIKQKEQGNISFHENEDDFKLDMRIW